MKKDSKDGKKPEEVENPADKVKRLMDKHGVTERLKKKKVEGPIAPAPEDGQRPDASKQKPLSEIRGVVTDAKAHERQVTPPEREDESSE